MKRIFLVFLLLPYLALAKQKVDLIIIAKQIYTASACDTFSAMAIKNGKVVGLGTTSSLCNSYIAEKMLFVRDKYIYPGFIDAHCHFSGYALDSYKCDLVGTTSYDDVLKKLVEYEKTNTLHWVYGRGWDQNDWDVKEFPTKKELDSLFPNKPVILKRIDGHAILCNQKALDMAAINNKTHINGGTVEIKNGMLTGILVDNAMSSVEHLIPSLPREEAINYLTHTQQECFSYGLTGIVDCGVSKETIPLLEDLYRKNILTIGNTILLSSDKNTLDSYVMPGPQHFGQLQLAGIKVYADGALGSRGACLLNDYSDEPGHRGMLLTPIEDMVSIAKQAIKYHWQLCTHAIGDSANRTILKLYASVLHGKNDLRWRIEHAQVVDYMDYSLFKQYSIIPSVQPTHATSDMPWAETRLGKTRLPEAYAYKKLNDQNGWMPLGTDFPVEGIDPICTFYSAVVRKDKKGYPKDGFLKENALSRKEALLGMTLWAAKSVFTESTKGSLEVGKDADLVILNRDIMTVPEKEILQTKVNYTFVKGNLVYKK